MNIILTTKASGREQLSWRVKWKQNLELDANSMFALFWRCFNDQIIHFILQ